MVTNESTATTYTEIIKTTVIEGNTLTTNIPIKHVETETAEIIEYTTICPTTLPNGHETTVTAGIAIGTNGQGQKVTKTVPLEYNESTLANGHVTRVASGIVKATGENGEEITKTIPIEYRKTTERIEFITVCPTTLANGQVIETTAGIVITTNKQGEKVTQTVPLEFTSTIEFSHHLTTHPVTLPHGQITVTTEGVIITRKGEQQFTKKVELGNLPSKPIEVVQKISVVPKTLPNSQVTSETVAILVTVGEELQPITKTIPIGTSAQETEPSFASYSEIVFTTCSEGGCNTYTTNVEVIGNKVITKQSGKPIVEEQTTNGIEHQSDKVYYTVVSGETKTIQTPGSIVSTSPAAIPVVTSKGSPNIVGSSVVAGSSVTTSEVSTSTAGVLQGNAASRQSFNYKFIVGLILAYIIA